jgi:hypothetical protein
MPAADAFVAKVAAVRARLAQATRDAGMDGDPMGEVVLALGEVLEVQAEHARLGEAQRQPLTPAERVQLLQATEKAAGLAVRRVSGEVVGAANRRAAILVGLGLAGLLAAAAGGGYVAGQLAVAAEVRSVEAGLQLSLGAGAAWLALMRANPDPRPALAAAVVRVDMVGRPYYEGVSLWREPPAPPRR